MKRLIILGAILITISARAQDSVSILIKRLVDPRVLITRTSELDSAAAFHANYLVANRAAGHIEEAPNPKTPMRRAEKFGDWGQAVYEVCWVSEKIHPKFYAHPTSTEKKIEFFKESQAHWNTMTIEMSQHKEVRFGYSFIEGLDWVACVIIYSVGPQAKSIY